MTCNLANDLTESIDMDTQKLIELHELAKSETSRYTHKRSIYGRLSPDTGRHHLGIIGPRGVGKTILLRQYALDHAEAFYLSADVLDSGDDLWILVKTLREHFGYTTFLIDEIHFLSDAAGLLKRLYDFLDVRVFFTSSMALAMHASQQDLSRRVQLMTLYPFSFREYLAFVQQIELPSLTLSSLVTRNWTPDHLRVGHHFDRYLKGGLLPFSMEEPEPLPLLANVVEKIITRDIPTVIRLALDELPILQRLLQFIGRSPVDGINYSTLARNLSITKYKAEQYVSCLEKAFVLHAVFPTGTNVLREPKILMAPPYRLLYSDYQDAIGGLREDFFAESMKQAGIPFHYLKSTRGTKTPDFLIDGPEKLVIEVGGKGKGREQFKGITIDRKVIVAHVAVPNEKQIPLHLLGFLASEADAMSIRPPDQTDPTDFTPLR